jgi:hypothetical protein
MFDLLRLDATAAPQLPKCQKPLFNRANIELFDPDQFIDPLMPARRF